MKILIVYYSRTNVTKMIAEKLQKELKCDIEEITDNGNYNGKLGYLKGGMTASMSRTSDINPIAKNPSDYDLVIVGTPVWASNIATPVFTYLMKYRDQINKMASFCTCISSGWEKTNQISIYKGDFMSKNNAVLIGFILAVIVKAFFAHYEFIGLLIVGFITGYLAHDGALGGLWSAALAGALGTIISAIIFIIIVTLGGSFAGIFGGLTGFTVSGVLSLFTIIETLIYYAIVMGITGAIGGAIASKD